MTIYLIRHGETEGNANRILQFPHTPLSERGQAQARALGDRMRSISIHKILSSDHERAHHTARAVAETTGAPLQILQTLGERNFGVHRGTPVSELTVDVFAPDYDPPEGESNPVFHQRIEKAWEEVLTHKSDDINLAVVCHGLVCRSIAERCVEFPENLKPQEIQFGNTSVTEISGPPWSIVKFACTDHLPAELASVHRTQMSES